MTPPVKSKVKTKAAVHPGPLTFPDNGLAMLLFGSHHQNLARIEQKMDVAIIARGNELTITGDAGDVKKVKKVLNGLYSSLENGKEINAEEVDAVIRMATAPGGDINDADLTIRTNKRHISPRTPVQADYLRAIDQAELVFGEGPAGTGKTYLAVAAAVSMLVAGRVERIVLSRPAVEAGERLGFLPGDLREKIDPYLAPLYDALYDMMPADQVMNRLNSGEIEVAPLAFMRGRTLSHAFVILDEAQNATRVQLKMFLTRLGEGSRMGEAD